MPHADGGFLLERRLDQLSSALADARAEADRARAELAEVRERDAAHERTVAELRARVDDLVASRETLLSRVAEWQQSVRQGDAEAIDLAEFIGGLQGEILELEHRNAAGERREEELRQRLERAASDRVARSSGDAPPAERRPVGDNVAAALAGVGGAAAQVALLLRLGRSGGEEALHVVSESLRADDTLVRAAAYEALGRLLEQDPTRFEALVAPGLADADARVRRRVILAVAAARGVRTRSLLEPLRGDPDAQVRRVALQVLRTMPAAVVSGASS